jgi:hypothetical protein
MISQKRTRRGTGIRFKLAAFSGIVMGLLAGCFGSDPTPANPDTMCYTVGPASPTPTETVLCYMVMAPTMTSTPTLTPTPTLEIWPTCYVPEKPSVTPGDSLTPESRDVLRLRLLAEGRFPEGVAKALK